MKPKERKATKKNSHTLRTKNLQKQKIEQRQFILQFFIIIQMQKIMNI